MRVAKSLSGKVILLSSERWYHITESHNYMAGNEDLVIETIETPDFRENQENFIITSFMTSKGEKFLKKEVIWQKSSLNDSL